MPYNLTDFAEGSKAIVAPERTLTELSQGKANLRATEQQNDIRQLEVDSTKKLGEVMAAQAATDKKASLASIVPPEEDLTGDYRDISDANRKLQEGQQELAELETLLKASRNTANFDQHKATYDLKLKQVEEAKKTQQTLVDKHLGTMLSAGLSVDPDTGEGYDAARELLIANDQAAARASGVTNPEQLAKRKAWMEARLPNNWSDKNAKYALSTAMKEMHETKNIIEVQRLEDARKKAKADALKDEEDRAYKKKKLDLDISNKNVSELRLTLDTETRVNASAQKTINKYRIDRDSLTGLTKEEMALDSLEKAKEKAKHMFGTATTEETLAVERAQTEVDKMNAEIAAAEARLEESDKLVQLLQPIVEGRWKKGDRPADESTTKKKITSEELHSKAMEAFGSFEPTKYDYGINPTTGKFARKLKTK